MIRVEEALKIILEGLGILAGEEVELTGALDRVVAEDIYADVDIPLWDNSAMDGYALKFSDTFGATKTQPKILRVIQDLPQATVSDKEIGSGEAMRIMTGAPIPKGADAVIMLEETQSQENKNGRMELIKIYKELLPGENIRKAGEDIKKGERVIEKGTLLKAAHIGLLASLGKSKVKLTRRPKVAVLATGDEVIDVDEKLEPGKLRNSNTYSLCSQILKAGGIPKNLGIAPDSLRQLKESLKAGLDSDIIVTSGGVSVGAYDFVKQAFISLGADIKFWKVLMRPGKPIVFGTIRERIPLFGLPGNPVSSMVSFEIFVRPAILRMLGQNQDIRKEVDAILEEDIKKKRGFKFFLRAKTRWESGAYYTRRSGPQGSGILKSMAVANSLMILPEEAEFLQKGVKVKVRFLD